MMLFGNKTNKVVQLLGYLTAILCFSHISHAAPPRKPLHPASRHPTVIRHAPVARKIAYHDHAVTHHRIVHPRPAHERHHAALSHVASHHEIIRHPVYLHPSEHPTAHHIVYRRSFRRPDFRSRYLTHRATPYHHIRRADYLWCVPYARDVSHIDLTGDAFLWWAEAAGRYQRGQRPEQGAVLNFRSSSRIPLGHVAVVSEVVNSREILVDQANWVRDSVSHNVPVMDVSPNNDWSEVQVSIGDGRFGATYPTYGFIYDQHPGSGVIYAQNNSGTEVAAAPPTTKIRLIAPDRTLR